VSMCGQHAVMGLVRTVSSLRPASFNAPATDETAPSAVVGAARPPGVRICAPAKTRC
jgi:hypothetical protein